MDCPALARATSFASRSSSQSSARSLHQRRGVNQTMIAALMQAMAGTASTTQKTGAPISRSRTVPPPTPVTSAKKAKVTSVWRSRAAASAPDAPKTKVPTMLRLSSTGPIEVASEGVGGSMTFSNISVRPGPVEAPAGGDGTACPVKKMASTG